ncbi:hypothetical protein KMW28_21595 [Flammeovirga yaeyamensis]|uniref:Uncharacterized protein n=1 Tax=Flammeovirga yaeyamensis TaxID=367791 RepID=A0AAX1NC32_9BACT|nr:hypothetical protein [Flammeovirga yaeyamensis]MBB3697052.1 hypothetical protein [Flammeovirga yaeyamensis]NMF33714.1 hypothetical protein [Flammeovirga yaeyamensis]QWG05020.1 hypothetical protein KMW28_21595 [Flammeovirga yaeyamensis]
MKNLKIHINKIPILTKSSKWADFLVFGVASIIIIILLPIILIVGLYSFLNKLFSKKSDFNPYDWNTEINNEFLEIKWKYCEAEKLPKVLSEKLEENNIGKYASSKDSDFFDGYFTDFRQEIIEGVFVQKVELNSDEKEIIKMPLYFYEFESGQTKEIQDFKEYSLDLKGGADEFMIYGFGNDEEIQITIKRD